MKIEHVAFNMADPLSAARWYVEHLGLTVKRRMVEPPYGHFLADDSGTVMIEIYHNPDAPVPDYHAANPLTLHLALTSSDVAADAKRLVAAGASLVGDVQHLPGGDVIAMLRDPWGFAVQLVHRGTPLI